MIDNNFLGKKLKNLRKEKMMTLQQLAEKSDISAGYLSKIERGFVNPSVTKIQKLCFALGVPVNELMVDKADSDCLGEHGDDANVFRKDERATVYGVVDLLRFESIFEENNRFKVNVMTLARGMKEQSYSVHMYDEFGIVAKGKLGLTLDDRSDYELSEGDCILIHANTKHAITNCSPDECVSYWIEVNNN